MRVSVYKSLSDERRHTLKIERFHKSKKKKKKKLTLKTAPNLRRKGVQGFS